MYKREDILNIINLCRFRGQAVGSEEWIIGNLVIERGFKSMIYHFDEEQFDIFTPGSGWVYVHVKPQTVTQVK